MGTTLNPVLESSTPEIRPEPQSGYTDLALEVYHRYQQLCLRRDGWRNMYMLLSKYLLLRPIWFGDTGVPWRTPRLSVVNVADDAAVTMAYTAATALAGALWPNTAETFEVTLKIPPEAMSDMYEDLQSDELKLYEHECTRKTRCVVDEPKAGFLIAHNEVLLDDVVYGTTGIYAEEQDSDESPVHYRSVSVETCVIDEGANKYVDTVMFEYAYTAKEAVSIYGKDAVSERTRELYKADLYDDYIKVIHALYPRAFDERGERTAVGREIGSKPYASVHFEYDSKHVIMASGMDELPVFVKRFTKRPNELYGRSLALGALPSIKELNVLRRAFSMATEKILDPPLGIYHDQIGGNGQVDLSAHARVPLFTTGRVPQAQPPIIKLLDIGEPQIAKERIAELTELIGEKFLLDKLLDFNNKTRMTKGEADMRNDFRNQALSSIFSRHIIELLNPLLIHTMRIMLRRGLLGLHPVKDQKKIQMMTQQGIKPFVMPKIIAQMIDRGFFPFAVRFISPAARAMRADSLQGLNQLTNYCAVLGNAGHPEAWDNMILDKSVQEMQHLSGAPRIVMRGQDSLKKVRKQNALMQQQKMQLQQGEIQATIAQKGATAAKNYAQSQEHGGQGQPLPGGNGAGNTNNSAG